MKKILSIIIALCSITLVSCDKETEGISKLTAFPEFKMEGAAFMNVKLDPAGDRKSTRLNSSHAT